MSFTSRAIGAHFVCVLFYSRLNAPPFMCLVCVIILSTKRATLYTSILCVHVLLLSTKRATL